MSYQSLFSFFRSVVLLRLSGVALGGVLLVLGGCQGVQKSKITVVPRFVMEVAEGESYAAQVELPISGVRISVGSEAVLSEYDVVDVKIAKLEYGRCLQFILTRAAARDFYATSSMNLGRRLVLLLNGQAEGVRVMDRTIGDGVIFMFLEVPDEALDELVKELKGSIFEIRKRLD